MPQCEDPVAENMDPAAARFLQHLAAKGGSVYTERNYQQALREFAAWHKNQRGTAPDWAALRRDDFRDFLRFPAAAREAGRPSSFAFPPCARSMDFSSAKG